MMLSSIKRFFKPGIEVYKTISVDNGFGGAIESWELFAEIEGLVRPMNGDEKFSSDKNTSHKKYKLYCEKLELEVAYSEKIGIEQKDRIKFEDKFYEVLFINNVMNFNEFLQIDLELIE